jgi:hypothetical protein
MSGTETTPGDPEAWTPPPPPPRPSPLRGSDILFRPDDTGGLQAVTYGAFGDESAATAAHRNDDTTVVPTVGDAARMPGLVSPTQELRAVPVVGVSVTAETSPAVPASAANKDDEAWLGGEGRVITKHRERKTPWVRLTLATGAIATGAYIIIDQVLQHRGR